MKIAISRLLLKTVLIGGAITPLSTLGAENKASRDEEVYGGSALVLIIDGKVATTVYYVGAYFCAKALEAIEAKARDARPRLKIFGICTTGAPPEPRR